MTSEEIKQARLNSKKLKRDQELFRFVGEPKKLINVNILDELYEGRTISDYLNELEETLSLVEASKSALSEILEKHGYNVTQDDLKSLLNTLSNAKLINPNKNYNDIIVKDGYAVGKREIEGVIIEDKNLDVSNGCYKVVDYNRKLVLDEEKLKRKVLDL